MRLSGHMVTADGRLSFSSSHLQRPHDVPPVPRPALLERRADGLAQRFLSRGRTIHVTSHDL